jgi:hypothetical protein
VPFRPVVGGTQSTSSFRPISATPSSGFSPVAQTDTRGVTALATQTDEHKSIGGFVRNLIGGVAGTVQGIGELAGAGIQDVVGGVQQILPGTQSLERRLETEGSNFNQMALDLIGWGDRTSLLLEDLKTRYGPLVQGDFDEFRNQLYQQPLSFGLDAVMVAGAAAAPARGAEIVRAATAGGKFSTAMAAEVAGRTGLTRTLLGPGTQTFGSTTSTATKTARLSNNPMIRELVQRPLLRLSSEDIVKAANKITPGTRDFQMAQASLISAAQAGTTQALKPFIARAVERRGVGLVIGMKRAKVTELTANAVRELYDDTMYGHKALKHGETTVAEVIESIQGSRGSLIPHNLPTPVATVWDLKPNDPIPLATKLDEPTFLGYWDTLSKELGFSTEKRPYGGVRRGDPYSPHSAGEGAKLSVRVANMNEAASTLERAAAALRGTVVGVKNYMDQTGWKGIHGFIRTADGDILELSIATGKMARAQEMASMLYKSMDEAAETAIQLRRQAQDALKGSTKAKRKIPQLLERAEFWEREAAALKAYSDSAFEAPTREFLAQNADEIYDAASQIADEQRMWTFRHLAGPELKHGLTGQLIMNRAYGPQRLTVFNTMMADLNNELTKLFKQHGPSALPYALVRFPEDAVRGLVGGLPKYKSPGQYAQAVTDWMRTNFREAIVQGDFPGFTWEEMHAMRQTLGQSTPSYYPHLLMSDSPVSEMMTVNGRQLRSSEPKNVSKNWMGHLYEEGTLVMDPIEAYARISASIAKHQELIRYFDEITRTWGRRVSAEELPLIRATKQGAEVFYNPTGVKAELNLRSMIEAETYQGLAQGLTMEAATVRALEQMLPNLSANMVRAANGEMWALPRHVAAQVAKDIKRNINWKTRVFWDAPMALWRSSVLAWTPRWIVNNTIGNIVFTSLKDPRALFYAMRQLSRRQRAMMEFMIGRDKLADIERGFAHGLPAHIRKLPDEALLEHPRVAAAAERLQESRPVRAGRTVSHFSRSVNSYIEEAWRRGVYLSAAEKANVSSFATGFGRSKILFQRLAKEGISEADHVAAIKSVDAVLGNYTRLSPFEQDIVRRWMAPFYPFYRHTVNFTLRMPFQHPLKARLLNELSKIDEDFDEFMPEWLQSGVIVGEAGDGEPLFQNFQNANPLTAAVDMIGGAGGRSGPLSLINPAAKIVLEHFLKTDLFRGKEWTQGGVVETSDGSKWTIGPNGTPVLIDGVTPPVWRHIAMQFPQFTIFEKLQAVMDPGYGAQYTATGDVITTGGEPRYPMDPYTIFTGYMGIPMFGFNPETYKFQQLQAQAEAQSRLAAYIP